MNNYAFVPLFFHDFCRSLMTLDRFVTISEEKLKINLQGLFVYFAMVLVNIAHGILVIGFFFIAV